MTQNEYLIAWLVYLGSFSVCYAIFWYFLSKLPWREFKQLLLVLVAVFFLVPWTTDTTHGFLSPAWMVSISDSLLSGPKAFWRAGLALVMALIIAVFLSTAVSIYLWLRSRKLAKANPPAATGSQTSGD